jgi:RNA polymerase sigma factor (sigma-70 family)
MPFSDKDLIAACRQGDSHAWEALLNQYERLVYYIPLHCGLSQEEAADIVQITFTFLMQSLDDLRDDTILRAWLATVARRHTWRMLKKSRRETPFAIGDKELSEHALRLGMEHFDPLERWELAEWISSGLSKLSERCRELLLALYFDRQPVSYEDIATRLNMPHGSIGPTRARCLEHLKRLLTGN